MLRKSRQNFIVGVIAANIVLLCCAGIGSLIKNNESGKRVVLLERFGPNDDTEGLYDKYSSIEPPSFELSDGRKARLYKEPENTVFYYVDDSNNRVEIPELSNLNMKYSAVFDNSFYLSNDVLYGTTTSVMWKAYIIGRTINLRYIPNNEIKRECLFSFNTKTQQAEVIYKTKGGTSRIIGYDAGVVYLFEKNAVYKKDLDTKKKELIYELETDKQNNIRIRWVGRKMIIFDDDQCKELKVLEL